MKKRNNKKKGSQSNFSKLSVFQNQKYKFKKKCPLSGKGAPVVDYKNIKLLKRYVSENGKILPPGKAKTRNPHAEMPGASRNASKINHPGPIKI